MKKEPLLYTKSLKEQIYEYLREEIHKQNLQPGAIINMDATSRKLGISKTPLRDALLQLEMEGFVTIAPRRGIYVNSLAIEDISDFYQVIGSLEGSALLSAFPKMRPSAFKKMHKLIAAMDKALQQENFSLFYERNLEFHDIYLLAGRNDCLIKIVTNLKKRLYDLPSQSQWVKEWEESSMQEHRQILSFLEEGKVEEASDYIRNVHWSFKVQEKYIRKYYKQDKKPGDGK
ncbi:MAG: GntR family transcriptional regulator [bacterium]|nr:GntR family transcriptional regulator [bacterium]